MRVMCIDDTVEDNRAPKVHFGEIYEVLGEHRNYGIDWYLLFIIQPGHINCYYAARQFIPLSDIDETILNKQYATEQSVTED